MSKVVTFTTFYNEHKLLDLRIAEEVAGGVDRMFVVESDWTYTYQKKPRELLDRGLVSDFVYLIELDTNCYEGTDKDPWTLEQLQRNAAWTIIGPTLNDDDIIICSDLDETIRRQDVPLIVKKVREVGVIRLSLWNHYYKVNYVSPDDVRCVIAFACTVSFLRTMNYSLTKVRRGGIFIPTMEIDGHHFDYLNTPEKLAKKVEAFAHTEFGRPPYTDPKHIAECIDEGRDLFNRGYYWHPEPLDKRYPIAILEHQDEWREWIA